MAIIVPLKSVFDDKGVNAASKSIKSFAKLATAALGVAAVGSFLGDSAKAATDDAKSQTMLERQLKATTNATASQLDQVNASIASMERMSAVADDNIRPAFAQLTRATGDVGDATKLTQLALDVSAGTGKDLTSVSVALGKAYQGNTGALQKLGINVKGMKDPMGALQKQFEGAAKTAANADPYQQMSLALDNVKESVGRALLPVLQRFAQWITDVTPQIELFFKNLADPMTQTGAAWKAFTDILGATFNFVTKLIVPIGLMTAAVVAYQIATKAAAIAQALLDVSIGAFNPVALAIGVGVLAAGIIGISIAAGDAANAVSGLNGALGESLNKATGPQKNAAKLIGYTDTALQYGVSASTVKTVTDAFNKMNAAQKTLYNLQHHHNYQMAQDANAAVKARLSEITSSTAAADNQANKQKGWSAAYNARMKQQTQAEKDAAAAAAAAAQKVADAKTALATALQDFMSGFNATGEQKRQLGTFESNVVQSFSNIKSALTKGVTDGVMTASMAAGLGKFADTEQGLLGRIARARDGIATKLKAAKEKLAQQLSDTKSLIDSTKQAVISSFDITSMKPDSNLAETFAGILEKTRAFAANLKTLQSEKLDKGLFAQIVNAGVDTGGATAAALVSAGQAGVNSLNETATALSDIAGGIGQTASEVAFGSGADVTQSLINGLKSKDNALKAVATMLGVSFKTAFGKASKGKLDMTKAVKGVGVASDLVAPLIAGASSSNSNQVNVTVNAGMGADGNSIAKALVTTLKKYERTNGAIWMPA